MTNTPIPTPSDDAGELVKRLREVVPQFWSNGGTDRSKLGVVLTKGQLDQIAAQLARQGEALRAIQQRANESGTGEMALMDTIHAMHALARCALSTAPMQSDTGVRDDFVMVPREEVQALISAARDLVGGMITLDIVGTLPGPHQRLYCAIERAKAILASSPPPRDAAQPVTVQHPQAASADRFGVVRDSSERK